MKAGLCSVTLRAYDPTAVVDIAERAGLAAIEWGGDVHVPHGDDRRAREVGERTRAAGIDVASYGSYLAAGAADHDDARIVLRTAVALGAPHLRVWCARGADRERVVDDLRAVAKLAADAGLSVSTEFHPDTITETAADTIALIDGVGATNLSTYWQPHPRRTVDENLGELALLGDRVSHVHVFRWQRDGSRLPLADGADLWPAALATLPSRDGRVAFLEFVRDDDPEQAVRDAAVLRDWLAAT